ncbi:hypothetical protein D3C76_1434430 [compost metagenome]
MAREQVIEGANAAYADQPVELLAGVGEVLAQAFVDRHATGRQFVLEDLLEQRRTAAAAGGGLGATLDRGEVATATVDGSAHRTLADVMA